MSSRAYLPGYDFFYLNLQRGLKDWRLVIFFWEGQGAG
jgi:hypothetical protein